MLTVVSFAAVVWSCHTTPSIPHWRESTLCVTRSNNGCKRDYAYCCLSDSEKIKIISSVNHLKIQFHIILQWKANWNSAVPSIDPNQRYIAILNKWRYIELGKRIIFQEGYWISCCLSGLSPVCEISVKMQVVNKELMLIGLCPRWPKASFICSKSQNAGELHRKLTINSTKFHVNFFQWCLIMQLEYVIKYRLFTRKWHMMEQSVMWQNGIWLVEYNSSTISWMHPWWLLRVQVQILPSEVENLR